MIIPPGRTRRQPNHLPSGKDTAEGHSVRASTSTARWRTCPRILRPWLQNACEKL
jgi:hypothetical protein